jgi:hypothetical protein
LVLAVDGPVVRRQEALVGVSPEKNSEPDIQLAIWAREPESSLSGVPPGSGRRGAASATQDTVVARRIVLVVVAEIIAMPRAYTVEETRGVMKFVVDSGTDLVLGAALLSIDAQEIINTVTLAMRHGITATALRDSIYTHPSSTEALNEVLGTSL